jgi:hypothetical protein
VTPKPLHYLYITASDGNSLKVLLGDTAANITGGYNSWEVVSRPKRVALTRFQGRDPYTMEVPVTFDGYRENRGQELEINKLMRMSTQPNNLAPPPTVKLRGAVPRHDLTWVIQNIDWETDGCYWTEQRGVPVRLRQKATITFLQFVDEEIIITPGSPALKAKPKEAAPKKTVDATGKTPKQVSQEHYGTPNLWQRILSGNPWLPKDPRQKIPAGRPIVIPGDPKFIGPLDPRQPKPNDPNEKPPKGSGSGGGGGGW